MKRLKINQNREDDNVTLQIQIRVKFVVFSSFSVVGFLETDSDLFSLFV